MSTGVAALARDVRAREAAAADIVDERRFDAFVAEQRERAVGVAWRLVGGDAAAAEDVAQEAFVRAFQGLGGFRGTASLATWFYRILVREAHRHRRWRWIRARVAGPMPAEPADPRVHDPGDPGLRRRIATALDALPRGQREAFVLVHLEGFTVSETAAITGRAAGTIKSHLSRALHALRADLADLAPPAGGDRS